MAGFNHRPDGCDGSPACKATCRTTAIHAEQDAILRAGGGATRLAGSEMLHVKTVDGSLVPSGEPSCPQCSKFMLHAGIEAMWLYHATGWRRYPIDEFHRLSLAAQPPQALVREDVDLEEVQRAWFYAGFAGGLQAVDKFGEEHDTAPEAFERMKANEAALARVSAPTKEEP